MHWSVIAIVFGGWAVSSLLEEWARRHHAHGPALKAATVLSAISLLVFSIVCLVGAYQWITDL